jgi:hypothetical protein
VDGTLYLADTNVLLRLVRRSALEYEKVRRAVEVNTASPASRGHEGRSPIRSHEAVGFTAF